RLVVEWLGGQLRHARRVDDRVDREQRRLVELRRQRRVSLCVRGSGRDQQRDQRARHPPHSWLQATIAQVGTPKRLSAARGAIGSAPHTLSSTTNEYR